MVGYLLKARTSVHDSPALEEAARGGHEIVVDILLKAGADESPVIGLPAR